MLGEAEVAGETTQNRDLQHFSTVLFLNLKRDTNNKHQV